MRGLSVQVSNEGREGINQEFVNAKDPGRVVRGLGHLNSPRPRA